VTDAITLHGSWLVRASRSEVFDTLTDFERWPEYFPKVAESVRVVRHGDDHLDIDATVKSFGQRFPVTMSTQVLPGRGFTSENASPKFGTSGHEEVRLSDDPDGTVIDYTYQGLEKALRNLGYHLDNSLYCKIFRALVYFTEETQLGYLNAPARLIKQSNQVYIKAYQHHPHGDRDDTPVELREDR